MGESNSVGDKFRQPCSCTGFCRAHSKDEDDEDEGFMLIPSDQDA
jgi:hypothetical protein